MDNHNMERQDREFSLMTSSEDFLNKQTLRLQMYNYYGLISFQVAAIAFGAAIVLITLPFANIPHSLLNLNQGTPASDLPRNILSLILDITSEGSALGVIWLGWRHFEWNQKLATRWAHEGLPKGKRSAKSVLEDWIDSIEYPSTLGKSMGKGGRVYITYFRNLVLVLNILAMILLVSFALVP